MGLEGVELIMDLEVEFQISIPDDDAETLQTLGDTRDCILRRLRDGPGPRPCPSAHAFYLLRRELSVTYGTPRHDVHPDREIGTLIPPGTGRSQWKQVAKRCGLPVPPFNVLKPFAERFPPPQTRIRTLIHSRGPASYRRADGTVDPDAVWRRIKAIVATQAGVPESELRSETRYYPDLF